ncbi:MAG TPA: hypothetical protein VF765_08530 [Polyangiaceae bacterium]
MTPPPATRLSLLSPELVLAADPGLLRALFDSCWAPELEALVGARRTATARALWGRRVTLPVAEVLDDLARLATPLGRDALVEAARDTQTEHDGWEQMEPVDLAAKLLAARIMKGALLTRAHLRLTRLPHERPTYELRGAEPRRVPEGRAKALVEGLCAVASGPGGRVWSEAWVMEDEEGGDLHAVLLWGAREAPRADAFRFRVSDARLAVTTSRPQRLDAYGAAWGRALYGEERFFLRAPSLTLKPLQALGAPGLAAAKLPGEVQRARVIACTLDTGDADRLEARGPSALARLEPYLRAGGHLTRATVRFDIAGEVRQVDAVLQLPHRIDVGPGGVAGSGARGPRLARETLARLGLLSPGTIADDVTTLLPLVHPEWRWQELVGDQGLGAMLDAGVLEQVAGAETRRTAGPGMRWVGRSAIAFPLFRPARPTGEPDPDAPRHAKDFVRAFQRANEELGRTTAYYVVPDDWSIRAVTVSQQEMEMLRLSLGALLRKGRREMGLQRGERPKLPRGVLWVGELRIEQGAVRFFYVVRAAPGEADRAAIGRAVAKATGFGRAVVLVPGGRRLGRDFLELELSVPEQLGAASWRSKMREAAKALGIEDQVPAVLLAPEDARLVVDPRRERAVLDGVTLEAMGESGYRLLLALAQRGGGAGAEPVPTRVTDRAISGARESDGATRNAAWRMSGWLEKSFAAAGRPLPEDVKRDGLVRAVGRRGWTLTVKAHVT